MRFLKSIEYQIEMCAGIGVEVDRMRVRHQQGPDHCSHHRPENHLRKLGHARSSELVLHNSPLNDAPQNTESAADHIAVVKVYQFGKLRPFSDQEAHYLSRAWIF